MFRFATLITLWFLCPVGILAEETQKRVYDITLHSQDEIRSLLEKVEQVAGKPRAGKDRPLIALVLHGPEVEMFAIKNYDRYMDIVDRAAKLDALGNVEVKMCRQAMGEHHIKEDDIPGFIETVPYGPDEIRRLQEMGYSSYQF